MQKINVGDTIIFDENCAGNFDNPKPENVGIVIDRPAPTLDSYYARWGDGHELWFDTNDIGVIYKIIPKVDAIDNTTIDELCDLLIEACNEGHSLMQTKTLRRVMLQLKQLNKPALNLNR